MDNLSYDQDQPSTSGTCTYLDRKICNDYYDDDYDDDYDETVEVSSTVNKKRKLM